MEYGIIAILFAFASAFIGALAYALIVRDDYSNKWDKGE